MIKAISKTLNMGDVPYNHPYPFTGHDLDPIKR
jgi:hypothetical protein